jgi:hypothetical protein
MVDDDLNAELSAMQQIAETLIRLDPAARSRALHWIQERFRDDTDHPVAPAPSARLSLGIKTDAPSVPAPELSDDEALSVAALEEFFEPKTPPSVTELPHEFATEFQDFARKRGSAKHGLPAAS